MTTVRMQYSTQVALRQRDLACDIESLPVLLRVQQMELDKSTCSAAAELTTIQDGS